MNKASDSTVLQLLDVLDLRYENNTQKIGKDRTFCALSLRRRSRATIRSGENKFTLSDGALMFFPANTPYTRVSEYDEMTVVHFTSSAAFPDKITLIDGIDRERVARLFERVWQIWQGNAPERYFAATAILYELVAAIYQSLFPLEEYSPLIRRAIAMIRDGLHDPDFSVQGLADGLAISATALRNAFHKEVGCSPQKYLIRERMNKASFMLSSGYWTVTQVAERLGFDNQKYFSSSFCKHFGYPPSKQRYHYQHE